MTVIVSIFVWGLLIGGLLGPILAVPLTATVKVLLARYVWGRAFARRSHGNNRGSAGSRGSRSRASRSVTLWPKVSNALRRKRMRTSKGLRHRRHPRSIAFMAAAFTGVAAVVVLLIVYAPATYNSWHESRLLKRATKMLHEQKLDEAALAAHEALRHQRRFVTGFQRSGRSHRKRKQTRNGGVARADCAAPSKRSGQSAQSRFSCAPFRSTRYRARKRSNTFRLTTATRPPITSSPAGSRARRATRPMSKSILPPRWRRNRKTISTNSISRSFGFTPTMKPNKPSRARRCSA